MIEHCVILPNNMNLKNLTILIAEICKKCPQDAVVKFEIVLDQDPDEDCTCIILTYKE